MGVEKRRVRWGAAWSLTLALGAPHVWGEGAAAPPPPEPSKEAPGERERLETMLYGALGLDRPVKLEQLPFGAEKRFVLRVPVGGIDPLKENAEGWRMEDIFTLADEPRGNLKALREEYRGEWLKLQKQLEAAQQAVAREALALRRKYELRANDLLTGQAKSEKEKLDTLAKECCEQKHARTEEKRPQVEAVVEEVLKLASAARETGHAKALGEATRKGYEVNKSVHDFQEALTQEAVKRMQDAVTGDAKLRLEEEFQRLERKSAPPAFPGAKPAEEAPKKPDPAPGKDF